MRKPTESEAAFARAVRFELDKINSEESTKTAGCTFNSLQLMVATQIALSALMEMHDAETAEKVIEGWKSKVQPAVKEESVVPGPGQGRRS